VCKLTLLPLKYFRFVTRFCHVAITDVKDCAMQITVVTVQEQEKGNVHVGKLVSMLSYMYKHLSELLFLVASG